MTGIIKKDFPIRENGDDIRQGTVSERTPEELISQPFNFVLIDAALWDYDINVAKEYQSDYRSLFRGKTGEELNSIAPFLFPVEQDSDFEKWIERKIKKDPEFRRVTWINAPVALDELRKHLRRFLRVEKESGEILYFRFYDPQVLKYTLVNLTQSQAADLFTAIGYLKTSRDILNEERYYTWTGQTIRIDKQRY